MKDIDMKNRVILVCNLFSMILLISVFIFPLEVFGQRYDPSIGTAEFAKYRIKKLQQTSETLRDLAAQPLPSKLADKEKQDAEKHTKWLKGSSQKLNELAERWNSSLTKINKNQGQISKQKQLLEEMNQSFSMQYLALQENMQNESRRFSLISNIMKTKHDTAKNAINNLR
jgi:hypothetical protein